MFLVRLWAYICLLFIFGDTMLILTDLFYRVVIRGKSKRVWRNLIENTIKFQEILEDNHVVFGVGSIIAIVFHICILRYLEKISVVGILSAMVLCGVAISGIIYKYIYRNKIIEIYHKRFMIILWVLLIIHIITN